MQDRAAVEEPGRSILPNSETVPEKQYPNGRFVPYTTDADYFGVYCPQTREVYLVPVSDAPEGSANLRIDRPMNNQTKRIRWAKDYVIATSAG